MKKVIALILALALVLGLSTSAMAYTDKILEAPKAKDVEIDGDLSEWDTSKCFTLNSREQVVQQIEHWDGIEDCSMEVYAMWDEENLYIAMKIIDDTPLVYREGFSLDDVDSVTFFFSTDPDADPDRTEYTATDWRVTFSAEEYKGFEFYNYINRDMIDDPKGWETEGEDGDEMIFDDYEAAIGKIDGGFIWESRIPLEAVSNKEIPQLVPEAGKTIGFDFSIIDVDLPCPGIHSLRMQYSANLDGSDRTVEMHNTDENPSLWAQLKFVD